MSTAQASGQQLASSQATEVVKPHHFGARVVPGPTWEYGDQLNDSIGKPTVVVPTDGVLQEWARSCLGLGEFNGMCTLGGWSPARSCCVRIVRERDVRVEHVYYKAGDRPCEWHYWLGATSAEFSYDVAHATPASAARLGTSATHLLFSENS